MAARALTGEQIGTLELKTDRLFESYEGAVETESFEDATRSNLLVNALKETLEDVTKSDFMKWNRNTKRAQKLDRYILQFALLFYPAYGLKEKAANPLLNQEPSLHDPDYTFKELKELIDNDKSSYAQIRAMCGGFLVSRGFKEVVEILEYVRKEYQRPAA